MNKVILVGHMAADVKVATLTDGREYAFGRVAVKRNYANKDGVYEADFVSFKVFAPKKGVNGAIDYLKKGQLVSLEGAIRTSSKVQEDGTTRYFQEIIINFDGITLMGGKKETAPTEESPVEPTEIEIAEISADDLPF